MVLQYILQQFCKPQNRPLPAVCFVKKMKEDSYMPCNVMAHKTSFHIGALQCADCFHSQNRHTVLSRSDSQDPGNLGMLAGVVVWLISASDMADADKCCSRCRPVFLLTQVGDVADASQYFFGHRPVILMELWPMQARIFANTGQ